MKEICQYDKYNNLIKIWNSITQILEYNLLYNKKSLRAALEPKNVTRILYGFKWSWGNIINNIKPEKEIHSNGAIEKWKFVKNYEQSYQISDHGRVWSIYTNNYMSPQLLRNSYYRVLLLKKIFYIHNLVATHFLKKIKGKKYINHINHNRLDNNIINLEWVTHKENINAMYDFKKQIIQYDDNNIIKKWINIYQILFEYKNFNFNELKNSIQEKLKYNNFYWKYVKIQAKKQIKEFKLFPDEIFKSLKIYDGYDLSHYYCSNYGLMYNSKTDSYLLATDGNIDYPRLKLTINNSKKRIARYIHVIVAKLFCINDDPITKTQVNHKNKDKGDYYYLNLEWCSKQYNSEHANAKKIKQIDIDTRITINIYPSITKAAIALGNELYSRRISAASKLNQKAYGYYWKIID